MTIEFFRVNSLDCNYENASHLPFEQLEQNCGIICNVDDGPTSPMRGGSANNIYVIPTPDKLSFQTATLLAAACCIPAILSLVSMWTKILEINSKKLLGNRDVRTVDEEAEISGTNGATTKMMREINDYLRKYLKVSVEIPVFGAAILAILIIGERNFFSTQVRYQTEPIASIGMQSSL